VDVEGIKNHGSPKGEGVPAFEAFLTNRHAAAPQSDERRAIENSRLVNGAWPTKLQIVILAITTQMAYFRACVTTESRGS
jgi:hypothetical protein